METIRQMSPLFHLKYRSFPNWPSLNMTIHSLQYRWIPQSPPVCKYFMRGTLFAVIRAITCVHHTLQLFKLLDPQCISHVAKINFSYSGHWTLYIIIYINSKHFSWALKWMVCRCCSPYNNRDTYFFTCNDIHFKFAYANSLIRATYRRVTGRVRC